MLNFPSNFNFFQIVDAILTGIDEVSKSFLALLEGGTSDTFAESMNGLIDMNHKLLDTLGVSHPAIEEVKRVVSRHGLHAKLTGAGGGGCVIVYSDGDIDLRVTEELKDLGFQVYISQVGGPGVQREIDTI